jgi:DNA-binding transcriptional regulator YbjK
MPLRIRVNPDPLARSDSLMDTDRKTLIADSALILLGRAGAKGLTHRAVDAQAGLPLGSTSFYCRTRLDLLTLTLKRHAELDLADLQADAMRMATDGFTAAEFTALLMDRLAKWLSAENRERLLARFQLILMATCEPQLADTLRQQRERFLVAAESGLKRLGRRDAAQVAPRLVAVIDGILLDHIQSEGAALVSLKQRRALIALCLQET